MPVFEIQPDCVSAQQRQREAALKARETAQAQALPKGAAPGVALKPTYMVRAAAVAASPRAPIATPALQGSISLKGARIDDLVMTDYRETVDPKSPAVKLFNPEGAEHAWFAARPSGTENVYKIYAESFRGPEHLAEVQAEAKRIVDAAL